MLSTICIFMGDRFSLGFDPVDSFALILSFLFWFGFLLPMGHGLINLIFE